MHAGCSLDAFCLTMPMVIRQCTEEDLLNLEWYGTFTLHRRIIREAYERQQRGEVTMLVADTNGFPAGQVWVDFTRHGTDAVGTLWALRVWPWLRSSGLGTRLMHQAERAILARGYRWAELGVEIDNTRARRLYERLSYRAFSRQQEVFRYTTPAGDEREQIIDQWIMRKRLR